MALDGLVLDGLVPEAFPTLRTGCVNADVLAAELGLTAYEAADAAAALRTPLLAREESFIFETVLSDPVGDKINQLRSLTDQDYEVALIFIQIADPNPRHSRMDRCFGESRG